jgi:hypothetical protein
MAYSNPIPKVDDLRIDTEESEPLHEYNYSKESVYFAFIDVLGFKQVFDENRLSDESRKKDNLFADKFKKVFTYYFDLMGAADFMKDENCLCYAGQTSDSLYFYTERPDFLVDFLKIFCHLNVYAMTQDVFFRGGIAKGSLFYKEKHQFYGDSVIYAYLLESQISKNPIVIIDEKTYQSIESITDIESLVLTDEKNGRHYVKPFAWLKNDIILNINDSLKVEEIKLELLFEKIERNKSKFEYDAHNHEKYVFLLKSLDEYKSTKGIK